MQVCILLDRSGSMNTIWDEALNSIDAYVDELDPTTKVNFAIFDSQGYETVKNCFVKDWSPIDREKIKPRGMTPLYDSMVRIMNLAESINSDKTVLVVMTDGAENCSKNATLTMVKDKLKTFDDRNWQAIFLGANFDKVQTEGDKLGIDKTMMRNLKKDTMVMNMMSIGAHTMSYASTGAKIDLSGMRDDS